MDWSSYEDILSRLKRKFDLSDVKIIPNIYEDPECNEIYFYTCLMGGILRTDKIKSKYKNIWLAYHVSADLITILWIIAFLLTQEKINVEMILFFLHEIISKFVTHFVYGMILYHFKDIEQYVEKMDKYLIKLRTLIEQNDHVIPKDRNRYIFLLFASYTVAMIGVVAKLLSPQTNLNNVHFYQHQFPQIVQVDSIFVYLLMSLVQIIFAIHTTVTVYSMLKFKWIFTGHAKHIYGLLRGNLEKFSKRTLVLLEENHYNELQLEVQSIVVRKRLAKTYEHRRENISLNFIDVVAKIGKYQWEFIKIQYHLKGLIELAGSMFVLTLFLTNILLGRQIIGALKSPSQLDSWTIFDFCTIAFASFIFYEICNAVEVFKDEQKKFSEQVYFTCWYLLPKRCRQDIHIMLAQTQYFHRLLVFEMTPLNITLISRIMIFSYSFSLLMEK